MLVYSSTDAKYLINRSQDLCHRVKSMLRIFARRSWNTDWKWLVISDDDTIFGIAKVSKESIIDMGRKEDNQGMRVIAENYYFLQHKVIQQNDTHRDNMTAPQKMRHSA